MRRRVESAAFKALYYSLAIPGKVANRALWLVGR